MKKPEVIYSNLINLMGIYSNKPVKCKLSDNDIWWDESGNYDVDQLGFLEKRNTIFQFSSESKEEVRIWTKGALAAFKMINNLTKY